MKSMYGFNVLAVSRYCHKCVPQPTAPKTSSTCSNLLVSRALNRRYFSRRSSSCRDTRCTVLLSRAFSSACRRSAAAYWVCGTTIQVSGTQLES